jgi:glycosyltransferase involved in cell wall biosynthesis
MVILSLVEHANRSQFSPVVLTLHADGPVADRIRALGIEVETVGGPGMAGASLVRRLANRLRELEIDVLHTHNPAPHQHGAAARMMARTPVLVHTKHGRNNFPTRARRWAEIVAGRFSDMVVAVSDDAAEVARSIDKVPPHKLRMIHNGIALPPRTQRGEPGAGSRPTAVHIARLNRIKDQPTLLRAARVVADRVPGFRLDIVGDGPMGDIVRQLATDLGLADTVVFHGMQQNVWPYLDGADLFVLSSLSEGVSITLLEAMAAGLPIVATDVGGNREVVRNSVTGLLVPVGDHLALAERMVELLEDRPRAHRMGDAGRERVESDFNISRTVAEYETLYLDLLQRNRRRESA